MNVLLQVSLDLNAEHLSDQCWSHKNCDFHGNSHSIMGTRRRTVRTRHLVHWECKCAAMSKDGNRGN